MLSFINSFCYCISFTESSQFGFKMMSILLIPAGENNRHWFLFLSLEIVIVSSEYLWNNPGYWTGDLVSLTMSVQYKGTSSRDTELGASDAEIKSVSSANSEIFRALNHCLGSWFLLSTLLHYTDTLSQRDELRPCHNIQGHLCWMVGSPSVHYETML